MEVKEFFESIGLRVKSVNAKGQYMIYCPGHEDDTASLSVNPKLDVYNDHGGCFKGRGMGNFFMALNPEMGVEWETRFRSLFPFLGSRFYAEENSKPESNYPEIDIKTLPLADVAIPYFDEHHITAKTIKDFNIRYHTVWNALIVPIYGPRGRRDYRGYVRRNLSSKPKYLNGLTVGGLLFPLKGLELIGNQVIVVEGVFDAIRARQEGLTNCISTLGGKISEDQAKALGNYTRNVVLCADRDIQGVRLAETNTVTLQRYGYNLLYARVPGGAKDLAESPSLTQLNIRSYYELKAVRVPLKRYILGG